MRAASFVLYLTLAGAMATAGTITLSTDIDLPAYYPDPNEDITVFIHSDAPLFFMDLTVRVSGDATITETMDANTCQLYGWTLDYAPVCTVEDNQFNYTALSLIDNPGGVIGYFKFRCNSGQVSVYIEQEDSLVFSWTEEFTLSPMAISVGLLDFSQIIQPQEPQFSVSRNPLTITETDWPESEAVEPLAMSPMAAMSSGTGSSDDLGYDSSLPWVVIDSDITRNQVWEPNAIYVVCNQVSVKSLLVIEPGTLILYDNNCCLLVNDGGTLISQGTPDKPIRYSTVVATFNVGNDEEPYYPGIGQWWRCYHWMRFQYLCPIIIEQTASPSTRVSYSFVEGAAAGLIIDGVTLDHPIENNTFFGNYRGVYQVGPNLTDIRNNLFFYHEYSAIETIVTLDPNDVPEQIIKAENNTCDYGWNFGILIHGMDDPNGPLPYVVLANNVITENYYCGIYLNGAMNYLSVSNGYDINEYDKNFDFKEFNPVHSAVYPYDEMGDDPRMWHRLVPDCNFVDASWQSIIQTPLVGTSTDLDGKPDSGLLDLGYHYMDWNVSGVAKLGEIMDVAEYWLQYDPNNSNSPNYVDPNVVTDPNELAELLQYGGDVDGSGFVDLADFSILAADWRGHFGPEITPLSLQVDQEPNQITGDLTVTLNTVDPLLHRMTLWMDGEIISDITPDDEPGTVSIRTHNHRNGTHELKILGFHDDKIVASESMEVVFNNGLSSVVQPKGFTYGQDYRIDGITRYDYHVELYDEITETTVYDANSYGGLSLTLPAAAFGTEYGLYKLTIGTLLIESEPETMVLAKPQTNSEWIEHFIGKKYSQTDPNNAVCQIVISIGSDDLTVAKEDCWKGVLKACVKKRLWPILLQYNDCTWDNLNYSLHLPRVTMWYHLSHGNHDLWGQPPRQCIEIKDKERVFSHLRKDFTTPPVGYQDLSDDYEESNHSILELGFWQTGKLNWVQFNACHSARTREFPEALGIVPYTPPIGDKIFIGWNESATVHDLLIHYNAFEKRLWQELTLGHNLKVALDYAINSVGPTGHQIDMNFMYYGVADSQYAKFQWPEIN